MKVYSHTMRSRATLFVTPGNDHPENSAWRDENGKARMFIVEFVLGVADVDSQLGHYLIDKGYAQRSKLILPVGVAA